MEALKIIEEIQSKINEIHIDARSSLNSLNKRAHEMYSPTDFQVDGVTSCHARPSDYDRTIGKYAWGIRGEQIALYKLQGTLNKLKKKLENDSTRI